MILRIIILLLPTLIFGQNNKIHIGNASDEVSAIMQFDANDRGILIPRLTTSQRQSIPASSAGLFVYDDNTSGFWYFDGTMWKEVSASIAAKQIIDTDADTHVAVEQLNMDDDVIKFSAVTATPNLELDETTLSIRPNHDLDIVASMGVNTEGFLYRTQNHTLRFGTTFASVWESPLVGVNSMAGGKDQQVYAENGFAFGRDADITANGKNGTSFGSNNEVTAENGTGFGQNNQSKGTNSTTWGYECDANLNAGLAWGYQSRAKGIGSTSWGNSESVDDVSASWGTAIARGNSSAAWGATETNSDRSFAWGYEVSAHAVNETAFGLFGENYTPTGTGSDKLLVVGNGQSTSNRSTAFEILKDNSARFYDELRIQVENGGSAVLGLKEKTNDILFGFEFELDGITDRLNLRTRSFSGNDAIRMTFDDQGRTGIGRTPTTNRLEVNGNASKSVAGPFVGNSDVRLKTKIVALSSKDVLDKVLKMKPVSYEWNDDVTGIKRPLGLQYGFIAQGLETVWPENVETDNLGYLQTAYGDLDPFFIGAFRAQQSEIDALLKENETLSQMQSDISAMQKNTLEEILKLEALVEKITE